MTSRKKTSTAKPKEKAIRVTYLNGNRKTVLVKNIEKGTATDPREYMKVGDDYHKVSRIEVVEV